MSEVSNAFMLTNRRTDFAIYDETGASHLASGH